MIQRCTDLPRAVALLLLLAHGIGRQCLAAQGIAAATMLQRVDAAGRQILIELAHGIGQHGQVRARAGARSTRAQQGQDHKGQGQCQHGCRQQNKPGHVCHLHLIAAPLSMPRCPGRALRAPRRQVAPVARQPARVAGRGDRARPKSPPGP